MYIAVIKGEVIELEPYTLLYDLLNHELKDNQVIKTRQIQLKPFTHMYFAE